MYQYKQTRCEFENKYQKEGNRGYKELLPEFQGQQAQRLVGVSGVVLVVGKVGTRAPALPHLAIRWLPPQSGRSQPVCRTHINAQKNPKYFY